MDYAGSIAIASAIRHREKRAFTFLGHNLYLVLHSLCIFLTWKIMMTYKAALITGSADRLGRAMALELGRRGTNVVIHYSSSEEAAQDTVRKLTDLGVKACAVQADLLDLKACESLIDVAVHKIGSSLDVLINNASIFEYDNIETATPRTWDRHLKSNLQAPFILTQKFAEQAPKAIELSGELNAQACIINMVDQRVQKKTPEFMTYSIAKNALWSFSQTSAQALAPHIRVNAIGPGTTLIGSRQSQEHFETQRKSTILQRGPNTDDIVRTMSYFLDSGAVTGQLLCVDGGQSMGWQTPDILGVR